MSANSAVTVSLRSPFATNASNRPRSERLREIGRSIRILGCRWTSGRGGSEVCPQIYAELPFSKRFVRRLIGRTSNLPAQRRSLPEPLAPPDFPCHIFAAHRPLFRLRSNSPSCDCSRRLRSRERCEMMLFSRTLSSGDVFQPAFAEVAADAGGGPGFRWTTRYRRRFRRHPS